MQTQSTKCSDIMKSRLSADNGSDSIWNPVTLLILIYPNEMSIFWDILTISQFN